MITPYFVGTPRGNAYRALDDEPDIPPRELSEWLVLGKAQLKPGQALLKVARRRYRDRIYTWVGLYTYAAELDAGRNEGSYAGAGLLGRDVVMHGHDAINKIGKVQKYLIDQAIHEHKFIKTLDEVLYPGAEFQARDLRTSPFRPELGLRPNGERQTERDLFIYPDKSGPSSTAAAAQCIEWAQGHSYFSQYEELYLSVKGVDEPPHGTSRVSYSWVAQQVGARQEPATRQTGAALIPSLKAGRATVPTPPVPAAFPSQSPTEQRHSAPVSEPPMTALLPREAVQALVYIAEDLRSIRFLLQTMAAAGVALVLILAAGLFLWLSRTSPDASTLPVPPPPSPLPSTDDAPARLEESLLEAARGYYQAIGEIRISDAARMRRLSQSAVGSMKRNRAAFATYSADGFELIERNGRQFVVRARIFATRPSGAAEEGVATLTFEQDATGRWSLARVQEEPPELALLPARPPR